MSKSALGKGDLKPMLIQVKVKKGKIAPPVSVALNCVCPYGCNVQMGQHPMWPDWWKCPQCNATVSKVAQKKATYANHSRR